MIGSLKSMTFLEPHGWFNKILAKFKRTQVENIQSQYEKYGVRAFDFHIAFVGDKKKASFMYDGINYSVFSIYEYLNYLDDKNDVYVRVVLESDKYDKNSVLNFCDYCKAIETIYQNIKFIGGYRECDSKQLYAFLNAYPNGLIFHKRVDKLGK